MDEETKNWDVPAKFKDELDEIKPIFRAEPLPVFINQVMIEPSEVSKVLANALVEISFTIHHTYIKKKDESAEVDSFKAQIEQITILKKHVSAVMSNPTPRMGPLETHKLLSTSPSRPTKRVKLNVAPQAGPSGTSNVKERTSKAAKKIQVENDAPLDDPDNTKDVAQRVSNKGKEKEDYDDKDD